MLKRTMLVALVIALATQGGLHAQDGASKSAENSKCKSGDCSHKEAIEIACDVLGIDLNVTQDDDAKIDSGVGVAVANGVPVESGVAVAIDSGTPATTVVQEDDGAKGVVWSTVKDGQHRIILGRAGKQDEGEGKAHAIVIDGKTIVIDGKGGVVSGLPKGVLSKLKNKGIVLGDGEAKFEFKLDHKQSEDSSPSDITIDFDEDVINKKVMEKIEAALKKHQGKMGDDVRKQVIKAIKLSQGKVKSSTGKEGNVEVEVIVQDDDDNTHKLHQILKLHGAEGHLKVVPHLNIPHVDVPHIELKAMPHLKLKAMPHIELKGLAELKELKGLAELKELKGLAELKELKALAELKELKGAGVYQFKSDDGKAYKIIRRHGSDDESSDDDKGGKAKVIEFKSGDGKTYKVLPHAAHGVLRFESKDGKTIKVVPHEGGGEHKVIEFKSEDGKTFRIVPHGDGNEFHFKSSDAKGGKTPNVIVQRQRKKAAPHVVKGNVVKRNVAKAHDAKQNVVVDRLPKAGIPANIKQLENRLDKLEKKLDAILKMLSKDR